MSIAFCEETIASDQIDAAQYDEVFHIGAEFDADPFLWQSASYFDDRTEHLTIDELEDGYLVIAPIPITIERVDDQTYQAAFSEANIAISGVDPQDAYQSLIAEILDTYDTLSDEPALGTHAAAQLQVLRNHIVKT